MTRRRTKPAKPKRTKRTNPNKGLGRELRQKRQEARVRARDQRKTARLSKKQAKKLQDIYGDMSPEEINAINEIQPLVGAMKDELEDRGVPLEDEEDPIEIANKFSYVADEVEYPVDEETYDSIFVRHDFEENLFGMGAKNRSGNGEGGKKFLKGMLTFVSGGIKETVNRAEEKQMKGEPITKVEEKLLQANKEVRSEAKRTFMSENSTVIAVVIALLIAYFLLKK